MYMVVFTLGFYAISLYLAKLQGGLISATDLIYAVFSIVIRISLFYVFSKKYVRKTEEIEAGMQQI